MYSLDRYNNVRLENQNNRVEVIALFSELPGPGFPVWFRVGFGVLVWYRESLQVLSQEVVTETWSVVLNLFRTRTR